MFGAGKIYVLEILDESDSLIFLNFPQFCEDLLILVRGCYVKNLRMKIIADLLYKKKKKNWDGSSLELLGCLGLNHAYPVRIWKATWICTHDSRSSTFTHDTLRNNLDHYYFWKWCSVQQQQQWGTCKSLWGPLALQDTKKKKKEKRSSTMDANNYLI